MADQAERLRAVAQGQQGRQKLPQKRLSRIFVVASGKGGVGKTNLVVNLAIALGQMGQKVLILDTDLGMANVDILMDLKANHSLVDVFRGDKELGDVILKGPYNIEVVPGGSGLPDVINMDGQQREKLFSRLSYLDEAGKIILVDSAAGISREVLSFISSADELVLMTTPEPTAIADVYGMIKVVDNYKLHPRVGLVVNMTRGFRDGEKVYHRIENVCREFLEVETVFLGSIEFDQQVYKAVLSCYPYQLQFPRSRAAQGTRDIANRLVLHGESPPAAENKKKEGGLLKRLLGLRR